MRSSLIKLAVLSALSVVSRRHQRVLKIYLPRVLLPQVAHLPTLPVIPQVIMVQQSVPILH